jgi:hypothetical protein
MLGCEKVVPCGGVREIAIAEVEEMNTGATCSIQDAGDAKDDDCGFAGSVSLGTAAREDVDVDTAMRGRGPKSELVVGEMVGMSVEACVKSSEVAAELCFSTLMGKEWWIDAIIWVAQGTRCSDDCPARCMQL